jgi:hypothetical protein
LSSPDDADLITPAGRSFITVEHWLKGRLLHRAGARAIEPGPRGVYVLSIRRRGDLRRICWSPEGTVPVRTRGAEVMVRAGGTTTGLDAHTETVNVGYQPIMLVRRR